MATAVPLPNSQGALPQHPWIFIFIFIFFNLGCIHGGEIKKSTTRFLK
jgi:hypothetical protein